MNKNHYLQIVGHPRFRIITNPWLLVGYIILVELWLVFQIPNSIISDFKLFKLVDNFFQLWVPILRDVTEDTAEFPEVIHAYIVITIFLMLIKIVIFFIWLNSDRDGIYRFLIISPLTNNKPSDGDGFLLDPLRKESGRLTSNKGRSWFSRVGWSFLIIFFSAMGLTVLFNFGDPNSSSISRRENFDDLVVGGINLWFYWAATTATFVAFLQAISCCVVRDYCIVCLRFFDSIRSKFS